MAVICVQHLSSSFQGPEEQFKNGEKKALLGFFLFGGGVHVCVAIFIFDEDDHQRSNYSLHLLFRTGPVRFAGGIKKKKEKHLPLKDINGKCITCD